MQGLIIILFIISGISLYLQFKNECKSDFDEKHHKHFCSNKENIDLVNKLNIL